MHLGEMNTKLKIEEVKNIKVSYNINELCENMPKQFDSYFQYIRSLNYYDNPDYEYLKSLFKSIKFPKSQNFHNK